MTTRGFKEEDAAKTAEAIALVLDHPEDSSSLEKAKTIVKELCEISALSVEIRILERGRGGSDHTQRIDCPGMHSASQGSSFTAPSEREDSFPGKSVRPWGIFPKGKSHQT